MSTLFEPTPFVWTREVYERAGEVGIFGDLRVELIEGQVVQMSPMGSKHAGTIGIAIRVLNSVFEPTHHLRSQLPLSLNEQSSPESDIAVIRGIAEDYLDHHPRTADLVVEISDSTLLFDRTTKSKMYSSANIPEYWIINLIAERIEIFRAPNADDGGYFVKSVAKKGETISPLAAPGTPIRVDELLP